MEGWGAIPVTVAIIVASAVFVSIEFSVISSRRTRLEAEATTSRAARAAVRSASEVSVLLAGCQLGITACTLALGAVTEPALEHALEPLLEATGLPAGASYVVAFALALLLTTFLHLVVGEMAPKSWALSHPERTAVLFAVPMRAFMWVFRPVLVLLNEAANALVRRVGVEPVDEVAVEQNPDDLRQLVRHSAETGELDEASSQQLESALAATRVTVGELVVGGELVTVDLDAPVREAQEQARTSGHLRLLVTEDGELTGVVHVRDTLTSGPEEPIRGFVRDLERLDASSTVLDALSDLRADGTQIAVVERDGERPAVVTVADLLSSVMPATAEAERVAPA